jgi:hypothetical protein
MKHILYYQMMQKNNNTICFEKHDEPLDEVLFDEVLIDE